MHPLPKTLPRICVALGLSTAGELVRAAEREYREGNTFLELRLDYLRNPCEGAAAIRDLRRQYADLYLLATCRHQSNGGGFAGTLEQQIETLSDAARAGAAMLDLEIESAEQFPRQCTRLRSEAALVVSYHNFESTPALAAAARRLGRIPADAHKLITTARKPSDLLRIVKFFREKHPVPLVAFAMSEIGIPTRVLSLAAGCAYTYAAPSEGAGTAPGQIAAHAMRSLYRADKLGKHSRIYGVIADPVAHSKSPQIQNRAFHARRLDAVYLPFRVAAVHLAEWMKLAAELPVAGFSVTIPHKQRIIRYLDQVDPLARRIGAVNTVWRRAGKWRGANTDAEGVLRPLEKLMPLAHARVLLAGYGGAARAAAFALKDAGAEVTVTGRDLKRARALARSAGAEVTPLAQAARETYDALINATPVGMFPDIDGCLFPERIPGDVVFDMVYNPHETALLARAKAQGCGVIHGCEMFLEQAARQFEIWTGETAPRAVMREAL